MYENIHISEPKWKSWIVQTTTPLFTPDQCRQIIESGRAQPPQQAQVGMGKPGSGTDTKKRITTISWIPFKEMSHMYEDLNRFIQKANENHFGFGDIRITEQAQFTEYPVGGFYDWHMEKNVPRVVLIDTFKDEVEEAIQVGKALNESLRGIRIETPLERGGITPSSSFTRS